MELTGKLKPDLLLLDIRMPGCSGLDIAARLPSPRPQIIFCTAYDEHAVDAFELAATDYLLKPISRARWSRLCTAYVPVEEPRKPGSRAFGTIARSAFSLSMPDPTRW